MDKASWMDDITREGTGIEAFYAKFGDKLPAEMRKQLDALKARLA